MNEAAAKKMDADLPTAIDEGDSCYHNHIVKRINTEAPRLVQERNRLNQEIADLSGAQASWARYLAEKYGLTQRDRVEDDGKILRHPMSIPIPEQTS